MTTNNPGIFKSKDEGFMKFIWHSEKKEFLGRTGLSWLKIGVFYVFFYFGLAAFWAAMMAIFYQTIDADRPKYAPGPEGSLLQNPALGYRPGPRRENVASTLIWYSIDDEADQLHWTSTLDAFISDYEVKSDDDLHVRDCDFQQYEKEKEEERTTGKSGTDNRSCRFQDTWLTGSCTKAVKWGYNQDSPCVILKMNKMIDWEPDVYKTLEELPADMPNPLRETITNMTSANNGTSLPPMVWVSCEGETPADKESLPKIDMSPYPGFPAYYFPYKKVPGYRSPIIGLTIIKPKSNVIINVECRMWAKNIEVDRGNRVGMIHFEILVD